MIYTLKDAAERVGMKYHTFYSRMIRGIIPSPDVRLGRRDFYSEKRVLELIEAAESQRKAAV